MTGSIIGPVGKKLQKKKIKMTGSIIGPAMAGPTGPFATALLLRSNQHGFSFVGIYCELVSDTPIVNSP